MTQVPGGFFELGDNDGFGCEVLREFHSTGLNTCFDMALDNLGTHGFGQWLHLDADWYRKQAVVSICMKAPVEVEVDSIAVPMLLSVSASYCDDKTNAPDGQV